MVEPAAKGDILQSLAIGRAKVPEPSGLVE
jgi:hypothetical protein